MELKNQNILFFTRTMKLGGTENVILQLCEILQGKVNKIIVCSSGGVNVEKLEQMGIVHYQIPDIENKNPKVILETLRTLSRVVKNERIDIIHTHHRMAAFYVEISGLYKKCVFINTSHNTFYNRKGLTQMAYKHANVVACGEMVRKNLIEYYELNSEQVKTITNSVNPFDGNIVVDNLIADKKAQGLFVVGNVGRLSEQKGMEYYIKAIPTIIKECPKAFFCIIGEGEDRQQLEHLVDVLGVKKHVAFLGYRTDVQNLMAQLDLIVLSSLWEGFPLTPIEAFSVGKTIVATGVDGTLEIIEDGVNGYLVAPANENEIAEKVIELYKNPSKIKEMEEHALNSYNKHLSYERFAERYIACYKECINERTS